MLSSTISMLTTASCMFPLHQGTLLWHWMVYSHIWPLSSHGCWRINWKWTQIKPNFSLLGTNDRATNAFLCFLLSFLDSKLTLLNLIGILEYFLAKIAPFTLTYQQSVAHAFTICGICGVFAITLIWILQNCAKLSATTLVTSRLNYCNSLLYGIAGIDRTILQRNHLARLVTVSCIYS